MSLPRLALIPAALPLAETAARALIAQHRAALPDLSHLTVLVPTAALLRPLRAALAAAAGQALLGPRITTLEHWVQGYGGERLSALNCRLQLAHALERHPGLFPQTDPLAAADALFALFEDLSANAPLLAEDAEEFITRVRRGYGAPSSSASDEARAAHLLWRAYLQQTEGRSPAARHAPALREALAQLPANAALVLLGFDHFSGAECTVLRPALRDARISLWLHGRSEGRDGIALASLCRALEIQPQSLHADSPCDALFSDPARPVSLPNPPRVHICGDAEQEARRAEWLLRGWLLDGVRDIAVVTPDRRLARRLRALLERAGVPLHDEIGWALSTSRAAATLMDWLDTVHGDFQFRPLLGLLKSGFCAAALEPGELDALERDFYQRQRVRADAQSPAAALLRRLRAAAQRLPGLGQRLPAQVWCQGLLDSLQALPLWNTWPADAAGAQLLRVLLDLQAALSNSPLRCDGAGFRRLLERELERATFLPGGSGGPVRLLTPEQARGLRCEAVLIAGASAGQWGASPAGEAVFNHSVRAELGLQHWRSHHARMLAQSRALLEAAPRIAITCAASERGELPQPAPWLEALLTYGGVSADETPLDEHLHEVVTDTRPAPVPLSMPAPACAPQRLPASLSAHAHQSLVDCPYQFHARSLLRLRAPEEPDQPPDRRLYGERVHAILQRFQSEHGAVTPTDDETAVAAELCAIAEQVFAPDLRARALAQIWLGEFRALAPQLAAWLRERAGEWPQAQVEVTLERQLSQHLGIHGRVDRLEQGAAGSSIVDYKTSIAPKPKELQSGESVQATHYALLRDDAVRVEYLQLRREGSEPVAKPVVIEGEMLAETVSAVGERLLTVMQSLQAGAALPAHGSAEVCARCDYRGLCREGSRA